MKSIIKLKNVQKLGIKETVCEGFFANIYLLKNGQKFKEYKEYIREISDEYHNVPKRMEKSLYRQVKLDKNDIYSFPRKIVLDDGEIVGYLAQYEKGEHLDKIDETLKLEQLLKMIKKLEEETTNITELGLLVQDIQSKNILVYGSEIKMIDTDYYYFPTDKKYIEILKMNIREIFINIIHILLPTLVAGKIWDEQTRIFYEKVCNDKMSITTFLEYVIDRASLIVSVDDIETLRDTISVKVKK